MTVYGYTPESMTATTATYPNRDFRGEAVRVSADIPRYRLRENDVASKAHHRRQLADLLADAIMKHMQLTEERVEATDSVRMTATIAFAPADRCSDFWSDRLRHAEVEATAKCMAQLRQAFAAGLAPMMRHGFRRTYAEALEKNENLKFGAIHLVISDALFPQEAGKPDEPLEQRIVRWLLTAE